MTDDVDDDTDLCGAECKDGTPCEHPAGACPWHGRDDPDGGRPTKLTKERQEQIATLVERGHSMKAAARRAGIHPETLRRWLRRGEEQDEGLYADLADRMLRAVGASETSYVNSIKRIAEEQGDARLLMTMLKQRHPETWGDVDADARGGSGVTVLLEPTETINLDERRE